MSRRIAAFIRHADYQQLADTPSALQPFPLTQEGIAQAKQVADEVLDFVKQNQWYLDPNIHTSTSLRAWHTAQLLGEQWQGLLSEAVTLNSYDALTERSVGSVANLTTKQIEEVVKADPRYENLPENWKSNSHYKLPLQGAESLIEAGQRVAKHLTETMADMPINDDVTVKLFVGHGASFRHAAYELGVIGFEQISALSMFHAKAIYIEYQTDGTWQHIAGDWKVRNKHSDYTD